MEKNDLTLPAQRPATAAHAPVLPSRLNAWLVQTTLIAKLAAFYSYWLEEEVLWGRLSLVSRIRAAMKR